MSLHTNEPWEQEEIQPTPEQEEVEPVTEQPEEKKEKARTSPAVIVLSIALALALVVIVVGIFVFVKREQEQPPVQQSEQVQQQEPAELAEAHHVNAYGLPSYSIHFTAGEDGYTYDYADENGQTVTITAEELEKLLETEVASCGDTVLTNRDLTYYYNEQYFSFANTYADYLTFMIDTNRGLDEQVGTDGVNTWQHSFVSGAVSSFHQVAAVCAMAEEAGYEPETPLDEAVEAAEQQLQTIAAEQGYDTAEAFLKDYFGPSASLESYMKFFEMQQLYSAYLTSLQEGITVTDQQIEDFYTENEQTLTESYGIQKVDKNVVHVRHILIMPEETVAEDGTTSISEEAWAAAEADAQKVYDEWLSGGASELGFAAMSDQHNQDPGSQETGGLYENVYPGQMVAEFNDWCFADGRKAGDHGIVKTSYGYHLMYFCGEGDYIYWRQACKEMLMNTQINDEIANMQAKYPLTADLTQAVILDASAPTVPQAETETTPAE